MKKTFAWLVVAVSICLTGCSEKIIQRDTLSLLEDGKASYTIVTDFSDPSYNLNELLDMARDELSDYGAGVSITEAVVENGVLRFVYTFDSLSVYADFMDTSCFYGTVSQALKEGFKPDTQLYSVKDYKAVNIGNQKLKKLKLLVWNENISVRAEGNVLYHSENLKVTDKTDAHPITNAEGPYYVIFK